MRVLALLLVTTGACGPKTLANDPPPAPASDEPWVKEHTAISKAACDCESSTCLEETKSKLDALEAAHGGLDESPADVHNSRGKFQECYDAGTVDPVRDFAAVTELLCRCTNAACVDKALIGRLNVEEKYNGSEQTAEQKSAIAELSAKYDECKSQKVVSGETVARHVEKVTFAVCGCAAGSGCGLPLTSLPDYPLAPKYVDFTDEMRDSIKLNIERLCNCATNAGLVGKYGGISTRIRCPKEEK